MIEARGLVKRYGATAAVNDLSFTIRPGRVTGFLGSRRDSPGHDGGVEREFGGI
jgi:ABC-type Na+ transport system ATPase subunit NatA